MHYGFMIVKVFGESERIPPIKMYETSSLENHRRFIDTESGN